MLEAIRHFYADHISPHNTENSNPVQQRLRLATAALLIEMAQEDTQRHSMEFQAIHEGIREVFQLSAEDTAALIELADREAHEAVDHFEFTKLINEQFDYGQKCQIVELLWRVSLADSDMNRYEEQLVRKIAGLLFVEHKDYIAAKLRVQRDYSTGSGYLGDYEEFE